MTPEEWDNLSDGDIIRSANGEGWIVHSNYKRGGVAISRVMVAHNPHEWDLVATARYTVNYEHSSAGNEGQVS